MPEEQKEVPVNVEEIETAEKAPEAKAAVKEKELVDFQLSYVYKKVDSIVFGIMSPQLIKKMASAKIVTPELYDKEGYPVDGGLMDIRLGVIDPGLRCKTCGQRLKECPGHFGYIEMARPVIHINFVNVILSLLRGTCWECGRILLPKNRIERQKQKLDIIQLDSGLEARRKAIRELMTSLKTINKCPYCNAKQQKVIIDKPYTFIEGDKKLSPIDVRARLEKITDEDMEIFGLKPGYVRPEWMILTVLPIPPVTMRPSITLESGERSEDDLTHKLGDIVRINQRLFENINAGAPEIIIEDLWDLLQYHITTFFNNSVAQLPPARHRSGQPLKTIAERIESKEGRIRHNLAGKRTNFCSRTAISPDPMLNLNEVGVPIIVAKKLTVPERVNPWNINYLKEFIKRGPGTYPGANYILRPDGKRKRITDETKDALLEELQQGFAVERHLIDGDIAIFNRQPSLHRMSMMCHRVKVLPFKTFRMNPSVCRPYNADFDGDEMNLHIPQTEEARAEAEILMEVQTQMISPRYGLSVIGCVQDAISGNYILTRNIEMQREEAIDMLCSVGVFNFSRLPNKQKITGKELFSALLPEDFNFTGKARSADIDGSKEVVIKNGLLIKGVMDKANLGDGAGLMLRTLHMNYGQEKALEMLGRISKLGIKTLLKYGFTAAISDTDLHDNAKIKIREILNRAEEDVNELITIFKQGKLETFPGRTVEETLELKILETLNKARNETGKIVSEFAVRNTGSFIMSDSGSRGGPLNLSQMAACIGQQAMRGKRIEKGYFGRTLSCFRRHDLGSAAHGFIRSGYKSGMLPHEFFLGGVTGRDSLMDTALRTPKSGYLYRRLANAMQDLKVEYDGTVRDASKRIIQFSYGEDGMDVSKSEDGEINIQRIIDSL
jgi:DNA-directed RNA polymerase subunit A'